MQSKGKAEGTENFEDLSLYCSILNYDECMAAIYYNECEKWGNGLQLHPDSPCIDAGIDIEDMEYCGEAPDMGAYEYCGELSAESVAPLSYQIQPAYPNPFNPVTSIAYSLPQNGNIELIVYNIQGREIETLINDFQTSGYYSINWNATSYPSGVYLIRMESGDFTQTQKVVLVK